MLIKKIVSIKNKVLTKIKSLTKIRLVLTCLICVFTITGLLSLLIGENIFVRGYKSMLRLAGIYTEAIPSITINGDGYTNNTEGSWSIEKSSKWISKKEAEVIFDIKSNIKSLEGKKDIVLIVDVSGSMIGDKLDSFKRDSEYLINQILEKDNNKIAVIKTATYNSAEIVNDFTNNKELLKTNINSLTHEPDYGENYKKALEKLLELLENYNKEDNKDLGVLFITDGYQAYNDGQQAVYETIKELYPYTNIYGVQYGEGNINESLKEITDKIYNYNNKKQNYFNILLEAILSPVKYEEFILTDYIHDEYFEVESIDNISVDMGNVELIKEGNRQKVIWNINGEYSTGANITMKIKQKLKQNYIGLDDYFPTNKETTVVTNLPNEVQNTKTSNLTPVLQSHYTVYYDSNTPTGCQNQDLAEEKHQVYEIVEKKDTKLVCSGYQFKGWEISTENVEKVNEDYFIMPEKDVIIKGIWTKHNIEKSMDGKVREKTKLYNVLKNEAEAGTYAKEYTGEHQDSMAGVGSEKIYHWYASNSENATTIKDKNNVIFGGHCWQMIRTTDTGGVKLIYNGEVENNQCLDTRGTHVGYNIDGTNLLTLNNNYYYGTSYEYDKTTQTFSLSGDITQNTWSDTTYNDLIGKYTCRSTTANATCQTLYLVESRASNTQAYIIPLRSNRHYSGIGNLPFNRHAGKQSIAHVGYMYGDVYFNEEIAYPTVNPTIKDELTRVSLSTSFWYADSINYDSTTGKYSLVNPYKVTSTNDYSSLVGKYTFRSSDEAYTSTGVYYLITRSGNYMYYKYLSNGQILSNIEPMLFGASITENPDGSYTLNDTETTTLVNFYSNHTNYKSKYTCGDTSTTCTNPRYLVGTSSYRYDYIDASEKILVGKLRNNLTLLDTRMVSLVELFTSFDAINEGYIYTCNSTSNVCTEETMKIIIDRQNSYYKYVPYKYYANSVNWDGEKYTLVNPVEMENYIDLSNNHYMCLDLGAKVCNQVAYVYVASTSSSATVYRYILLQNGKTIEDAFEDMLTKNIYDSTMKFGVEAWYEKYMLNYDSYIEDTIFCNNRNITNFGPYNPNGGGTIFDSGSNMYFDILNNFSCPNETDRFSITNNKAKLKYKVGLMSNGELISLGVLNVRVTGASYYTISPYNVVNNAAPSINISFVKSSVNSSAYGYTSYTGSYNDSNRPAISLKPNLEYTSGNGSMEYPYIIETE